MTFTHINVLLLWTAHVGVRFLLDSWNKRCLGRVQHGHVRLAARRRNWVVLQTRWGGEHFGELLRAEDAGSAAQSAAGAPGAAATSPRRLHKGDAVLLAERLVGSGRRRRLVLHQQMVNNRLGRVRR